MVMGKDGFTMGIAVDELNISSVALEQEVSFTIDAVDGDYTGSVTAISYNGSTSGGKTAYQITATVDYVEGVYPGMSASAEIVIEDSGDGRLFPSMQSAPPVTITMSILLLPAPSWARPMKKGRLISMI